MGVDKWKTEDKESDVKKSFTAQRQRRKDKVIQTNSPAGGLLELPGKKWMGWILAQPKQEILHSTFHWDTSYHPASRAFDSVYPTPFTNAFLSSLSSSPVLIKSISFCVPITLRLRFRVPSPVMNRSFHSGSLPIPLTAHPAAFLI